jgi:hypothetical protein
MNLLAHAYLEAPTPLHGVAVHLGNVDGDGPLEVEPEGKMGMSVLGVLIVVLCACRTRRGDDSDEGKECDARRCE